MLTLVVSSTQLVIIKLLWRHRETTIYHSATMTMLTKVLARRLASSAAANLRLQDVVIVGGGPAGLSLLAALKSSNITKHLSCTLVEGNSLDFAKNFNSSLPTEYTNRVVSLTPKSIEFMEEKVGNWKFMNQDRIKFYKTIVAYDSQSDNGRISFNSAGTEYGVLAAMCENVNIQNSLLQRIDELNDSLEEDYPKAIILDNTKVVDIKANVEIDSSEYNMNNNKPNSEFDWPTIKLSNGEVLGARLLIGADGFNSPVRKVSGIVSRGWGYDKFGVVGTIKLKYEDFRSIAWQRFLSTGPLAILPLTEDSATIVWSTTPELSELLLKVDSEIFCKLIDAAMTLSEVDLNYFYKMLMKNPNDKSILEEISWRRSRINVTELESKFPLPVLSLVESSRARFPLKLAHADTYTAPRIALVGDAAHTVHPLAGQGLNMGQSDVASLISKLEKGVSRGLDLGSTLVLDEYTSDAWPSNHALLGICDKLHKIFTTSISPVVYLRGFGLLALNSMGFIKSMMVKSISGR